MIGQLLEHYDNLKGEKGMAALPCLKPVALVVQRTFIADHEDINKQIHALEIGCDGWLRRQSALYRTPRKKGESRDDEGLPLGGEWLVSDGKSLEAESQHLRQDGDGGWTLYTYREFANVTAAEQEKAKNGQGKVYDCLREEVELLDAREPKEKMERGKLVYYVYWGGEEGSVTERSTQAEATDENHKGKIRRLFARFAGFRDGAQPAGEKRS